MSSNRPAKGRGEGDARSSAPARRRGGNDPAPRRSAPARRGQPQREKQGSVTKAVQQNRRGSRFFNEVVVELRRVQWPTRSQLMQSTAVVLLVVAIVTAYLAAVDAVVSRVVDSIF
jgi:preprotein translocase subunit SecE